MEESSITTNKLNETIRKKIYIIKKPKKPNLNNTSVIIKSFLHPSNTKWLAWKSRC